MILVDSNIIIDYWKNPTTKKESIFLSEDVSICGIVISELYYGAKDKNNILKIDENLEGFIYLEFNENLWRETGKLLNKLRINGYKIPFQDVLIAALALHYNCKVWSKDKHFKMITEVEEKLMLFEENH